MHRPDYLNSAINAAASRDSIQPSLSSNPHLSLNHRRRPSLLQSAVYSNEYGALNTQYLPYLNREDREQIINSHMGRKVTTLLPQHYSPSLNSLSAVASTGSLTNNPSSIITTQPFNPHTHLALAQSTPPLNFLQGTSQSAAYLDSETLTAFNKRPRLSSVQPLLIDTNTVEIKKEPAYTVQVEAISPTPAEDTRADGSPVRTTKDDILQQIGQIDREITQTENQMSKLKKKQQELEALTNKTGKSSDLNEYLESKQQSITQVIYFENKVSLLIWFFWFLELFLTEFRVESFNSKLSRQHTNPLLLSLSLPINQKKAQDSQQLLEILGPRIVLPIYNQPSDNRVYHDNREKFVRFKGVLQEHFKQRLRRKQQREKFLTENYDKLMQEWLSKLESKDTNPVKKNKDNKLREFFEKQFPELKKLREDKERLSRAGQRVRSDADLEDIMDGIQEQELEDKKIRAYAVIPPIMHDVNERNYRFRTNNCKIDDPVREHKELMYLNVWTPVEKEIFREKFLQAPKNFGLIASYLERKSVADCVQYYYSSKKRENYKSLLRKNAKKRTRALAKQQQLAAQQAAQQEQAQQLQKTLALQQAKKQSELEKENLLKSDHKLSDLAAGKEGGDGPQSKKPSIDSIKEEPVEDDENCFKCINCLQKIETNGKVFVVNRTNCFLYGLSVEDVKRDSRLCKKCKVQFGTGECPVPSCKALKKPNRRLKTLPREWFELTPEKRYIISAELNFPLDCRRCCTRCWIRLIRKSGSSFTASKERTMRKFLHCVWDEAEVDKLKTAISKSGRNWEMISSSQVVTKSAKQCRQFYFYFKYNQNLEELMKMTTLQTDDFDSDTCWNEIVSDSESSEDEYLVERKILDPNLERLQDCKRLSSSQLSLKSDSSTTISADEAQSVLGEFDSRVTPPSRSSSVVPAHLAGSGGGSYMLLNDKMRPASSDNLDIDSKLKTNQKYLNSSLQKQRSTPLSVFSSMNKPSTPMPAFVKYLINPNAPTVQPSNQSKQLRQDSPIQSGMNTPTLGQPSQQSAGLSQSSSQMFSGSAGPSHPPQQQPQQTISAQPAMSSQPSKDKATCVRDLIYQTIDFTFNSSDKSANSKPLDQQQQIKDQKSTSSMNPSSLPSIYFPAELKRDTVLGDLNSASKSLAGNPALQHILPYNLSNQLGLSMAGHLNEIDEVQDLSKKSGKKELDDYLQPKNYSLSKSKNSDFVNLSSSVFSAGPSAMPPPAHSNQLSSRTATPVLDMSASAQQEQLQNFYMNANRHTDSPRSLKNQQQQQLYSPLTGEPRLGTPNHHLSSASPTPGGSSRSSGNKPSNQQNKVNIAPPPLIANSLINAANQQFSSQQQSSKNSKNNLPPASLQGSITHGTPVHLTGQTAAAEILQQQQQYLLNKESESAIGRITLGTPLYRGNAGAGNNSRSNMPKMSYLPGQNAGFSLPSGLAANLISPNLAKSNFGNESQLSSTQVSFGFWLLKSLNEEFEDHRMNFKMNIPINCALFFLNNHQKTESNPDRFQYIKADAKAAQYRRSVRFEQQGTRFAALAQSIHSVGHRLSAGQSAGRLSANVAWLQSIGDEQHEQNPVAATNRNLEGEQSENVAR